MFLLGLILGALAVLLVGNLLRRGKHVTHHVEAAYGVAEDQFLRTMNGLFGVPLVTGNAVTLLSNGDTIFPAMLTAIRGAQRTITFETFIYWSGAIGREFADSLAARARAGVRVHVLLDFVGSLKMDATLLEAMRDAGCELVRYHPPKWRYLGRLNNRTHRKLLIVDGRIAFTGGVGIAPEWTGHAQDPAHWRDSHFRVEGPVVAQMQATFMVNWINTRSRVEHDEGYFPTLAPAGTQRAQMFHSSPQEGSGNVRLMYLLAIAAARDRIRLQQAYFVPDALVRAMLAAAARRGVDVQVIVPGPHIDATAVRPASRARWGELLSAGVRIHEYQPTNYHCKIMTVDGLWSSVGSTNFDARSFRLNDEANLNVYDAGFAAELERAFVVDLGRSQEVTLEAWRRRPRREKVKDFFAQLLAPQL